MKTTMDLDDALVREAMAIHWGKTKTAVVELGLQELINADRRRRLGEAFGSQPDLRPEARRRSTGDRGDGPDRHQRVAQVSARRGGRPRCAAPDNEWPSAGAAIRHRRTGAAQGAVAEVVGHDEDDVGTRARL